MRIFNTVMDGGGEEGGSFGQPLTLPPYLCPCDPCLFSSGLCVLQRRGRGKGLGGGRVIGYTWTTGGMGG